MDCYWKTEDPSLTGSESKGNTRHVIILPHGRTYHIFIIIHVDKYCSRMEDCFRDACSRGDVDVVTNMVSELTPHELHAMLRSTSSCTGTPLFDAVLLQQVGFGKGEGSKIRLSSS